MSIKLLQTIAAAFARASSAFKKDGTSVTSGNPRYENIAQNVVVDKKRLWDAGTHARTAASGNVLSVGVIPSFTRATSGWVDGVPVNSGTPRYIAPVNLLSNPNDLLNAAWTKTNATITSGQVDPDGGNNAFYVVGGGAFLNGILSQEVNVSPGSKYTFVVYVKLDTVTDFSLYVSDNVTAGALSTLTSGGIFDVSQGTGGYESVGNGWYKIWTTTDVAVTETSVHVEFGGSFGNYYVYSPFFNKGETRGTISTGIYIEEAATNLVLRSVVLDLTATYLSSNSGVSLGGPINQFPESVAFGDNSVQRWAYKSNTMVSGATYTFSAYIQMDDGSVPAPGLADANSDFSFVFNNSNAPITYVVTPVSGTMYRVSGTYTFGGTINSNNFGIIKYTQQRPSTFKVNGYQLEKNPYATSYIPTVGSTVARNAETITIPNQSQFVSAVSGTIKTRVMPLRAWGNDLQMLVNLGGTGTSGFCAYISNGTGKLIFRYGSIGSNAGIASTTVFSPNTWYDIELTWGSSVCTLKINGAQEVSGSYTTLTGVLYADDVLWLGGMTGWPTRYADCIMDYVEFNKDGVVTRFDFNSTLSPTTTATWTSPWYNSTASGCIWESFAANKTTPSGTINTLEFRTALDASGTGASAWTSTLPATGQFIQAKITLNPNGKDTYPYVTDLTITPTDLGKGIVIEEATTNLIVSHSTPVTESITVTANGDYALSVYGDDTSSGSVVITHEKFEDTQADFSTGTLVGVSALASGAIALDVQADPTFTRATVATKKDFTQATSDNPRYEDLVTPFTLDLQHQFDAGTKEGVTTSSGAVSVDFTPTFTRATIATDKKLNVKSSGEIRYDDLVAPITVDTEFDWLNSGTKDNTLTTASSGDLTMTNGTPVFTRATVAYKKDGSQVASGAPRYELGKNLLLTKNISDFETDTSGWQGNFSSISRVTTDKWEGSACLRIVPQASSSSRGCFVSTGNNSSAIAGLQYTISCYAKMESGNAVNLQAIALWYDAAGASLGTAAGTAITINSSTWTRVSHVFTAPANTASMRIAFYTPNGFTVAATDIWLIDGAQLEQSSVVTTWVPGGQSAIMIEEATTNLLTANQSSVETDTTGFTAVGVSAISRDTTEKWEGNASLKVITSGGGAGQGVNTGAATAIAGQTYTGSVYVKGSGTVRVVLLHMNSGAYVTQTNGVVTTLDGTWKKLTVTGVLNAGANQAILQVSTDVDQATTFYVDNLQLEQKSYTTSWQIGGTARVGEALIAPVGLLNLSQGTVIIKAWVDSQFASNNTGLQYLLWHADGSSNNRILIRKNGAVLQAQVMNNAGAFSGADWSNYTLTSGWHTFAIRYSSNELSLWVDGVKRGFNTSAINLPTVQCQALVGGSGSGGQANAIIDEFAVFHEALSDGDMATLTAI